jgi:hypothetical protein
MIEDPRSDSRPPKIVGLVRRQGRVPPCWGSKKNVATREDGVSLRGYDDDGDVIRSYRIARDFERILVGLY